MNHHLLAQGLIQESQRPDHLKDFEGQHTGLPSTMPLVVTTSGDITALYLSIAIAISLFMIAAVVGVYLLIRKTK